MTTVMVRNEKQRQKNYYMIQPDMQCWF